MKILQLRFSNLNSLRGEWHIDLTHPAFTTEGLFAITGPTGAGKTTILDAICLALYGRTPRLPRITKASNEIMSRQTGECFAEVTFETQAGRFRCHWSQRRARKKPDGDLQPPKHEISSVDSGKITESSLRGVAAQIELVTGMDFGRFTRSMLLAQGGFAAFLQADPDERAPLLEQLTGTEIYSQISMQVHERQRQEQEKLHKLQATHEGIPLLPPEQEQALEQELAAAQREEARCMAALETVKTAIHWYHTMASMQAGLDALAEEAVRLQSDQHAFRPDAEALRLARCAASLDGPYASYAAARKQQEEGYAALHAEERRLPALEGAAKAQGEKLHTATQEYQALQQAHEARMPMIQQARLLDQQLEEQRHALATAKKTWKELAVTVARHRRLRRAEQQKRSAVLEKLALVTEFLNTHAQEEMLCRTLTGIEAQLDSLLAEQQTLLHGEQEQHQAAQVVRQAVQKCTDCQQHVAAQQQALKASSRQVQQARHSLGQLLGTRLLREYRTEKETLLREKAFHVRIAELETLRSSLQEGIPCPLCGAREHPFAQNTLPCPDDLDQRIDALTQLIETAETQELRIKDAEAAERAAQQALTTARETAHAAAQDRALAEQRCDTITGQIQQLQTSVARHKQDIASRLQPFGISFNEETAIPALRAELQKRLKRWETQRQHKTEYENALNDCNSTLQQLDAVIETRQSTLEEQRPALQQLQAAWQHKQELRKRLLDGTTPDEEEQRWKKRLHTAEAALTSARQERDICQQQWYTAQSRITTLQQQITQRQQELDSLKNAFSLALTAAGFTGEDSYLHARLPLERREALEEKAKALETRQAGLEARQQEQQARLTAERAKHLSDLPVDVLQGQCQEYEDALQIQRTTIADRTLRLEENNRARLRIQESQAAIEAQQQEYRRWDSLHVLIGSADGKKFRNFAQGLTFATMIAHANRQLGKMTDRYILLHDSKHPLELNVIDTYQAGEIRSTKNLSGGESFLVSLALALGLSRMASRNVRVDSLFLDEGFGTLDEESLETALETLAGLQQEGKLIGVISHIPALKERIRTRIRVFPRPGGKSRISGPGCRGTTKQ